MTIGQRLAEIIRSFYAGALTSARPAPPRQPPVPWRQGPTISYEITNLVPNLLREIGKERPATNRCGTPAVQPSLLHQRFHEHR